MKKIIGIVIASLVFCNIGFAEIRLIEKNIIYFTWGGTTAVSTFCVDGYKFIVAKDEYKGISLDLKQIFEERNGQSLPAKC